MLILTALLPLLQHAIEFLQEYEGEPGWVELLEAAHSLIEAIEIFETGVRPLPPNNHDASPRNPASQSTIKV
jgi:hypothetical protein